MTTFMRGKCLHQTIPNPYYGRRKRPYNKKNRYLVNSPFIGEESTENEKNGSETGLSNAVLILTNFK